MEAIDLTKNDLEFKLTYSQYLKLNVMLGWLDGTLMNMKSDSNLIELIEPLNFRDWILHMHDSLKTNLKDELQPIVMALRDQLLEMKDKNE